MAETVDGRPTVGGHAHIYHIIHRREQRKEGGSFLALNLTLELLTFVERYATVTASDLK